MSKEEEVYVFWGNNGEIIPASVTKLVVDHGVEALRHRLCYKYEFLREVVLSIGLIEIESLAFSDCQNLSKIKIPTTVRFIGTSSFFKCMRLNKVEFESSVTSSHQLQRIEAYAFYHCESLPRIKLPSSVTSVCVDAFRECNGLVEANLSTTGITEVSDRIFACCTSLQAISLPNTLERIGHSAFLSCEELVTVVVPSDSKSIKIESRAFHECKRLANLLLPTDSTADDSFSLCDVLHECYGKDASGIVAGLIGRFEDVPVHRMCYDHSKITVQDLTQQRIEENQNDRSSLVDRFEMTPFHVLFSTVEPTVELLDVLLDSLTNQMLKLKDANDKRPLDYLITNWTDETKCLLQRTLQRWMIDRLARWGTASWMKNIKSELQGILTEDSKEQRLSSLNKTYALFERYENLESTTILEISLWKGKLKSGWSSDGTKRHSLDRGECRCLSGSDVVIPNVLKFLDIALTSSSNDGHWNVLYSGY